MVDHYPRPVVQIESGGCLRSLPLIIRPTAILLAILLASATGSWSGTALSSPAPPDSSSTAADSTDSATEVTGARLRQMVVDGIPVLVIDEVRIESEGAVITGKVGRYDREAKRAVVEGDVRVVDGSTIITGDHGTFDSESGVATLRGNVEITQDDLLIRGPRAILDRGSDLLRLGGGVTVIDATRRVESDSLAYWTAEDRAEAFGDVRIDEAGEEATMRGEVAEYRRREGDLHLLERASLVLDEEEKPVEITARDLKFRREGKEVVAEGDVIVRQEGSEAAAEHALFLRDGQRAVLTGSPVARDLHGEVRGDTLEMGFEKGELRRLTTRGNAVSYYGSDEPEGGREEMWLRGESLEVDLEDGAAREVFVRGNAESVYFPGSSRQETGALRNVASADEISVVMVTGSPERVIFEGNAMGEYFYRGNESDSSATALADSTAGAFADSTAWAFADSSAWVFADSAVVALADSSVVALADSSVVALADSSVVALPDSSVVALPDSSVVALPDSSAAPHTDAALPPDSLSLAPGDSLLSAAVPREPTAADSVFAGLDPRAQPDSLVKSIRYQAARIDFLVERDEIILKRQAELFHEQLHLTAGDVRFSAADRTLVATESPVLEDRSQKMDGSIMTYEFNTREGQVLKGGTTFERGLYTGNRLFKSGDGVFHVKGAAYTTCDQNPPHYHFAGHQMKIYLNDKVVTRPLGLFIRRVPILALPFYIFPIKRGRNSGFLMPQLEFGFSQNRGRFVQNAGYYWVINDYMDLKGYADISENSPFFIGNVQVRYRQRYRLDGDFLTKFTTGEGEQRWDIRGNHRHDLGENRTLRVNADWVSDREFRRDDQGQLIQGRLETQLRSNFSFTKNWESQSVQVTVERTQNLQDQSGETEEGQGTVTGTIPSISYSLRSRPIGRQPDAKGRGGRWPFLASTVYSFSGGYRRDLDTRRDPDIYLQSGSARTGISDRRRLAMLNLGPSFSVSSTWDERLETADSLGVIRPLVGDVFRGNYSAGMDLQTEVYGTFAPTLGPFHGFRHILTPRASLSYSKSFDSRSDIEEAPGSGRLNLSIANRIETRLPGEDDNLRPVRNFLTINLNSGYDLSNRSDERWDPIRVSTLLRPGIGRDFQIDYSLTYDPYELRPTRYSTSTRLSFIRSGRPAGEVPGEPFGARQPGEDPELGYGEYGEGLPTDVPGGARGRSPGDELAALFPSAFTLGGTMSFAGGGGGDQTLQGTLTSNFRVTRKWRFDYHLRYDLMEKEVVGQSYTVVRDLHCWEAQFRRSFDLGIWEYYFRIAIKDLPEIFYERGQDRFSVPSFF